MSATSDQSIDHSPEEAPEGPAVDDQSSDWTAWAPKIIAKAVWDDRLVAAKDIRVPVKAKLFTHANFPDIHKELCSLVAASPPKGYAVHSLQEKRGECKSKGIAVQAMSVLSGLPLPKEPFRFLCLCTPECAYKTRPGSGHLASLGPSLKDWNTSDASAHLRTHNITASITQAQERKKQTNDKQIRLLQSSSLRKDNLQRYLDLQWVLSMTIDHLAPFAWSEHASTRQMLLAYRQGTDEGVGAGYRMDSLYNQKVKHLLTEVYVAHKRLQLAEMKTQVGRAIIPVASMNFDFCKAKVSGDQYAGMAVSFLTDTFEWRIRLISIRHFYPGPGMKKDAVNTVPYIKDALKEVGLDMLNLHGSSTDGGGEIRKACTQLLDRLDIDEHEGMGPKVDNLGEEVELGSEESQQEEDEEDLEVVEDEDGTAHRTAVDLDDPLWEWCISHFCNLAMVAACGWSVEGKPSKNPEAKELFDSIMSVIRSMRSSDGALMWFKELQNHVYGTRQKLKNIAPSRWSSVVKVLQTVLANWAALKQAYYQQFEREVPFADKNPVIHQLYSLLVAVVKVITACQAHQHPSAVSGYFALIRCRTVELDLKKPLPLVDPTTGEQQVVVTRDPETGVETKVQKYVQLGDLHPLVSAVRKKLVQHIDQRAFSYRFGAGARESMNGTAPPHVRCSYAFDMAMMVHPAYADLAYIDAMVTAVHKRECPVLARSIRAHIVNKVVKLTTAVILRERAVEREAARRKAGGGQGDKESNGPPPGSKRPAQSQLQRSLSKQAKAADGDEAHLYGQLQEEGERDEESDEDEMRASDEARELINGFIEWCKTEYIKDKKRRAALLTDYPREKVHRWWWAVGIKVLQQKWVRLKWVARALLSITAGSGNLERYFCNIPAVVTAKRSSMSPARVEMLIMCHILQQMGQKLVPDQIKKLSFKQVMESLPGRMKQVALMTKLREMFQGMVVSEEERDEWVPDDASAMAPWSSVAELLQQWDTFDEVFEAEDTEGDEVFEAAVTEGSGMQSY